MGFLSIMLGVVAVGCYRSTRCCRRVALLWIALSDVEPWNGLFKSLKRKSDSYCLHESAIESSPASFDHPLSTSNINLITALNQVDAILISWVKSDR